MAWQDEMRPTLRVMLGDTGASPTYSDASLEQTLAVAAKHVAATLEFDQDFVAAAATSSITPDPTEDPNRNDWFVHLVTLKAAGILDRTEASLAARRAIVVKDGSSAIDLSKVAENKLKLIEKGWNALYEDDAFDYQYGRSQGVAGAAVLGPFRLYPQGGYSSENIFGGDPRGRF